MARGRLHSHAHGGGPVVMVNYALGFGFVVGIILSVGLFLWYVRRLT